MMQNTTATEQHALNTIVRHHEEIETQLIGSEASTLLERMLELGAFIGEPGAQQLSPQLHELVEGMFHVLAGGEVCVTIQTPGHPELRNELAHRLDRAQEQTNRVNREAGCDILAAS
jgi:hypothetical protein